MSEIATPSSFRKSKKQADTVELPSGNRVKVRRPGMEKFLAAGFLPDPLAEEVTKQIANRTGRGKQMSQEELVKNVFEKMGGTAGIASMMRITDRVAAYCILEPTTQWHERETGVDREGNPQFEDIPEEERDESVLYTDEIELDDKMFLFQYCTGGTSDLNQFRQATSAAVAALEASGEVVKAPERDSVHSELV